MEGIQLYEDEEENLGPLAKTISETEDGSGHATAEVPPEMRSGGIAKPPDEKPNASPIPTTLEKAKMMSRETDAIRKRNTRMSRVDIGFSTAVDAEDQYRPTDVRRKSRVELAPPTTKVPFFQTIDIAKHGNQKEYLLITIRDFLLYLFFCIVVTVTALSVTGIERSMFYSVADGLITRSLFYTKNKLTKTFDDIRILDHIWDFINGTMVTVTYHSEGVSMADRLTSKRILRFEDVIYFGVPRVRQVRVRKDTCSIPEGFKYIFDACYYFFDSSTEDKEPFGFGKGTLWTYSSSDDTKHSSYRGEISTYSGGGYYMDFKLDEKGTLAMLEEMFNNTWIDHGTRAIFVDFVLYSVSSNLFCVSKLVFEIPPSGGVITTSNFDVHHIFRYEAAIGHFYLGLEISLFCLLAYYILEEIYEIMFSNKKKYFTNPWNYFDICIIIVGVLTVLSDISRTSIVNPGIKEAFNDIENGVHISFDSISEANSRFKLAMGVFALVVWLKMFKYGAAVRPGAIILNAFAKVKMELFALTLMLTLLIFGFAMFAHVIFGTHVFEFNTIGNSMFTLIGLFSGGLYFYDDCERARPILAPLYFILYIFVVILLFLNWFAAVIVHGLLRSSKDFDDADDMYDHVFLSDVFRYVLKRIFKLGKCTYCFKKLDKMDKDKLNRPDFVIIEALLRRNGFSKLERFLFFRRHGLPYEDDIIVTQVKMDNIVADINGMNNLYAEVDEHNTVLIEVERLKRKLEVLDHAFSDICVKVDVLLDKLRHQYESSKNK